MILGSAIIITLAEIDLGRFVLSGAIIIGLFLALLTIVRSVEIPIRIYLDKKKVKESKLSNKVILTDKDKGFMDR